MAISNNLPFSTRAIQDATTQVVATLPTANNTTTLNSAAIALFPQGAVNGGATGGAYPVTEKFLCSLIATVANGANNTNVNIWLQHTVANTDNTANGGAWANIPYLAAPLMQLLDVNGAGSAANTINLLLPPDKIQNFIRVQYKGEANGGNSANGTITLTLKF